MSLQGERAAGRFDRDSSLVDPRLGRAALALIGRVTNMSYSVAGKFVRG